MIMSVNKIRLTVCGSSYVVSSTDPEEYVQKLAEKLDEDMNELMAHNASASVTASAVVTAIGYLDEMTRNAAAMDNMRTQMRDYMEDAAKARLDLEQTRRELEQVQQELARLKERNA